MLIVTDRARGHDRPDQAGNANETNPLIGAAGDRPTPETADERLGPDQRLAVVIPPTGRIRFVPMSGDVVAMARREIGCATVERLHLGRALLPGGGQMWLDENGLTTRQRPNPRASAVLIASHHPPRLLRHVLVGAAVFTGPDDPSGEYTLGLSTHDAITLLHTAARARPPRTRRQRARGGPDVHRA
jgi:hypothetical protein